MGWLGWIILGGLAGFVANMITHEEGGLLKNIVLGIIGGLVGGWLVQLIGGSGVNGFNLYSFVVAVLGAILLIYIVRMIKK
ncbi:MAG: transglycosylase [Candidatus Saccharibacteria bacterium]|jgi:uncharacterized membrane protein YeaQ/YmgE (transglycosylase-associated protein family)|nr:transglycosylase [Candidatus Saccharibacteria bacterium]